MFERNTPEGHAFQYILKQAHVRLPEAVDGLHRITDQKQASAILAGPSSRQPLDQSELGHGGVLKLVNQ